MPDFFGRVNSLDYLNSPAFVIPAISAIGYLTALTFEIAYITFFGVSYQTAEVQLSSFVYTSISVYIITALLLNLFGSFSSIFKDLKAENPVHRQLKRALLTAGVLSIIVIPLTLHTQRYWFLSLILAYPLLIEIWWPIIMHPRTKGYGNKVIKTEAALRNRTISKLEKLSSRMIVFGLFVFSVAFTSGTVLAAIEENFKVTRIDNKQFIVVREYGDKIVLAELNKNHQLAGKYRIEKLGAGTALDFENIKIENLK